MPYVELHRNFLDFRDLEDQEDAVAESLRLTILGEEMGWPDLLTHRIVVILGEAGSGKTTEFREQASILKGSGKQAFFVPLEDLADRQLAPDVDNQLERWRAGDDEGIFGESGCNGPDRML